ncbi:MAG TPA: phosphatase PAP2 family protein [archaeon]|nr:phosphatase PAP2 family protein [archaeon]
MFEPLQPEIAFSHFVQGFSSAPADVFFQIITLFGNPLVWFALAAFLYWKGDEKKSFFIASTLLFAAAVVGLMKEATGRLRPSEPEFRVIVKDIESPLSFPSGHATTIAGIFGYYYEKITHAGRYAWIVLVLLVMLSRIYLGAHYLGDVIVGALFGLLIGRLVHYLEERYSRTKFNRETMLEEAGLIVAVVAALSISLFFRSFALASALLGYFAGAFAFKLLNHDSPKLDGRHLILKEAIGFGTLGMIATLALVEELAPEVLFAAGLWVTFIYPILYNKVILGRKVLQ